MRERAAAVEKALADVMKMCVDCRDDVFEVQKVEAPKPEEGEDGIYEEPSLALRGGSAVLAESLDFLEGGARVKPPPVLKEMKKSSLLA
jgi:elongator complex protein 1